MLDVRRDAIRVRGGDGSFPLRGLRPHVRARRAAARERRPHRQRGWRDGRRCRQAREGRAPASRSAMPSLAQSTSSSNHPGQLGEPRQRSSGGRCAHSFLGVTPQDEQVQQAARRVAATAKELNRLLIERETQAGQDSKRADLSANLITVGKNNRRLKVFNRGKGTARNIRLIDLQTDESVLLRGDIEEKFPLPILEQHQSVEVLAAITLGGPLRAHVKLVWDDETGSDHEKELTPSL